MKLSWLVIALALFLLWRSQRHQAAPVGAGAGNQPLTPPVASSAPDMDDSETEENDAPTAIVPVPSGSAPVAIISQSPFRPTGGGGGVKPSYFSAEFLTPVDPIGDIAA